MIPTMRWTAWTTGLLAGAVVSHACAVGSSGDCTENGTCASRDAGGDTPPGTDAGAADAGRRPDDAQGDMAPDVAVSLDANDTGVDGPTTCNTAADPKDASCLVQESYGAFVAPPANGGDDASGEGSRVKPYATVGRALQNLGTRTRVFVCNATYAEAITIGVVASIYGGFACPGADAGSAWKYIGGAAYVNSPLSDYAIRVDGVKDRIAIEDMAFASVDAHALDAAGNGRSSIAALVNGSIVEWRRVTFTAGSGADGIAGVNGLAMPNYALVANAPSGSPGTAADDGGNGSGSGGANVCANGSTSNGGAGGSAGSSLSTPGGDGRPGTSNPPTTTPSAGQDGSGGNGGAATCGAAPSPGALGGAAANGIAGSSYGLLSPSGWLPSGGSSADTGQPGQGGGGGGGLGSLGGSGGGAGGCGGSGGKGGGGGGASIALASIASTQVLIQCTLATSFAGNGGAGGNGENGQGGGGSANSMFGCPGAPGGNGPGGSGGAGGTGGISVGILSTGPSPVYDGNTAIAVGAAGARGKHGAKGQGGSTPIGLPGKAGVDGDDGHPGLAQNTLAP